MARAKAEAKLAKKRAIEEARAKRIAEGGVVKEDTESEYSVSEMGSEVEEQEMAEMIKDLEEEE